MSSSWGGGRAGWRAKAGIYLLFLAVYLAGASGHFYSTDHAGLYLTTQSIVDDGDLSINPILNTVTGRHGASYSPYGIGQALLSTPLYLAGRTVDNVGPARARRYFEGYTIGSASAVQWGGTVPIFFVSLLTQFVAPLVCVLAFMLLLELGFSRSTSFFTTLVLGFGTAISVAGHEYTQHALEALLLLGTIYVLFAHRHDLRARHAFVAGGLLGFGMLTRINMVVVAPAIGVYLMAMTRNARPRDTGGQLPRTDGRSIGGLLARSGLYPIDARLLKNAVAFLLPLAFASGVILFMNYERWGSALNFGVPTGANASTAAVPNTHFSIGQLLVGLDGLLLSPGRSIFLYSPPALLGLFAFRRFYEVRRAEALLFATVACTYLLFYSAQDLWHGGYAWGPRYLLPTVPLLVIPGAYLLDTRRAVLVAAGLAVAGFAVSMLGTVENVSYVTIAHGGGVSRGDAPFLFVPQSSPVPAHLQDLLGNRNVDLWLVYVWDQFGTGALLLTLAVPAAILAAAILLLRDVARESAARVTATGDGELR
jgi:hypothetical protein